jgi:hypothetical protein
MAMPAPPMAAPMGMNAMAAANPGVPLAESPSAYAIDCEFIKTDLKRYDGDTGNCVCSIGMVSDRLEKITVTRIQKPAAATVLDDTFVRTHSGLHRDWNEGCSLEVAQFMIREKCTQGKLLVGWELQSDLKALGFLEAAAVATDVATFPPYGGRRVPLGPMIAGAPTAVADVCDLTDVYRTTNGHKCKLSEAYKEVTGRMLEAHDAGDDAMMTMELYKHWLTAGKPAKITMNLSFFVVNVHNFQGDRAAHLWNFLRPRRADRDVVIDEDDGCKYKLKFRLEAERDAYLQQVRRAIADKADPAVNMGPSLPGESPVGSQRIDCGAFQLHLYQQVR